MFLIIAKIKIFELLFASGIGFLLNLVILVLILLLLISWIRRNNAQREYYRLRIEQENWAKMNPEEKFLCNQLAELKNLINILGDEISTPGKIETARETLVEAKAVLKKISASMVKPEVKREIPFSHYSKLRSKFMSLKFELNHCEAAVLSAKIGYKVEVESEPNPVD